MTEEVCVRCRRPLDDHDHEEDVLLCDDGEQAVDPATRLDDAEAVDER